MSMNIKANPPTILITGKNGQVGWELQRSLMPLGRIVAVDRQTMDLSDNDSIVNCIRDIKPDIIVNAAAYTAVDKAEEEPDLAMQINGTAPGIIAHEAKALGALLVHYSTDYVFDGTKQTPYLETDTPNPINEYGRSKLAGEQAIQSIDCDHLIFRTSWVYGTRGKNFLLTMLKLMRERKELRVIDDQRGTPTWSRLIAESSSISIWQSVVGRNRSSFGSGLFHLIPTGATTWYGFTKEIIQIAENLGAFTIQTQKIVPVTTGEYPTSATRPLNSRLAIGCFSERFGVALPSWEACLDLCLSGFSGQEFI